MTILACNMKALVPEKRRDEHNACGPGEEGNLVAKETRQVVGNFKHLCGKSGVDFLSKPGAGISICIIT